MNKLSYLLAVFVLVCNVVSAQSKATKKSAGPIKGPYEIAETIDTSLVTYLNKIRTQASVDSFDVHPKLKQVSTAVATEMAKKEEAQSNVDDAFKKFKKLGGTKKIEVLSIAVPITKGTNTLTVEEIVKLILAKWEKGKKEKAILTNPGYVLAGISAKLDESNKKLYVSAIFGGFNSFNEGAKKRKELAVKFSKKQRGLKDATDPKQCKNCEKFKDYYGLYQGVYEKDGKIYLKYDNLKALKQLLKGDKDGFAIDIVQKAQYDNPEYNIYDNNKVNKGIMLKKVYSSKLFAKNLAVTEKGKKVNTLDVLLGKKPKKLTEPYELNLLIIQDGMVCKTLYHTNLEEGDQKSQTKLDMLLAPDSNVYFHPPFEPKSETNILTFDIPFQKNKFDYKPEDMEPFLQSLQEPDFIIEGLYIYAYSSIEGDSIQNAKLQRKRAESVITALKKMQKTNTKTTIKTSDSWDLFVKQMDSTKYSNLTKMSKKEAIREINGKGLADEMEPYLAKQRFARIVMDVTYDTRGEKEAKFAAMQFNKAVKKGDVKQAQKIQYFIEKSVRENRYPADLLAKLTIPKDAKNLPLLMNRVVYRYFANNKVVEPEYYKELDDLSKLDINNNYVIFNELFCKIKLDSTFNTKKTVDETQRKVETLYKTSDIPKKTIDALNIELQFAIMDANDTIPANQPIVQASIDRIKTFFDAKSSSWQNALKLSYEIMAFRDFKFAVAVLEPFTKEAKVDEQLLFTYISACVNLPGKTQSRSFLEAMNKAKVANPSRYCKLFTDKTHTFQLMDNPFVKAEYKKANCKE